MVVAGSRRSEQQTVSIQTSGEYDALVAAMQKLERALAAAAPSREREWAERVVVDLGDVRRELERHRQSAEAADGLFAELAVAMPAAHHRIEQLRVAHRALLDEIDRLVASAEGISAGKSDSFEAIRRWAAALLTELRQHQAREVDLIYEAFSRDIGAVD